MHAAHVMMTQPRRSCDMGHAGRLRATRVTCVATRRRSTGGWRHDFAQSTGKIVVCSGSTAMGRLDRAGSVHLNADPFQLLRVAFQFG